MLASAATSCLWLTWIILHKCLKVKHIHLMGISLPIRFFETSGLINRKKNQNLLDNRFIPD